jgi:hypothetical protein
VIDFVLIMQEINDRFALRRRLNITLGQKKIGLIILGLWSLACGVYTWDALCII